MLDLARPPAERLFIPLTIGGGIRTVDDVARALRAGADKVGVNSAAVSESGIDLGGGGTLRRAVRRREHRREASGGLAGGSHGRRPRTHGTRRRRVGARVAARGAGEILLTSIDRDGSAADTTSS